MINPWLNVSFNPSVKALFHTSHFEMGLVQLLTLHLFIVECNCELFSNQSLLCKFIEIFRGQTLNMPNSYNKHFSQLC